MHAHPIHFEAVSAEDADELADLRVVAMRPSLERLGRFDAQRARDRFLANFEPAKTRHIVLGSQRIGFLVVRPHAGHLMVDHLYLAPMHQGQGFGAAALGKVLADADAQGLPVRVGALRESDSNRFYGRHGFERVEEADWDNYYVRTPANRLVLEQRLVGMVRASPPLMAALTAVRSLELRSWCIGAGAVRSVVWDALHGFDQSSAIGDVDVVHFDAAETDPARDAELERRLRAVVPALQWEVTNQAQVHRWFGSKLGQSVPPLKSLEEGVATWPEFATCVGISLRADGSLEVIAPHGLGDLFGLRVRHNPLRASAATYRQRVTSKRFGERWPWLSIDAG